MPRADPSLTLSARAEQEDELQRRWEALERREQRLAKAEAEKLAADERADQARLLSAIKGSNIPLAVRSENIVGPVSATPASSKYLRNLGIITAAPKQLQDAMDAEGDCEIAHGNTGTGRQLPRFFCRFCLFSSRTSNLVLLRFDVAGWCALKKPKEPDS